MTRTRRKRTHCQRGHQMTPDNTGPQGRCYTCKRENNHRQRAAARATANTLATIRHQTNINGLARYIHRRRLRGIPTEGLRAA